MTMRLIVPAAWFARALGFGAVLAAGLTCGAFAQTRSPGPFEVIGYANSDLGGPSKTWSLPADRPYLTVPYVGDEVNGAIATIRIGSDVGAALFQRALFAARDLGCAREIGSDRRPDLNWLGPTARFEPGGAGMPPDAVAAPDPKTGGYASLILFRKDLGPPPGVLLLHRRRTIGSSCPSAAHKIYFNRMFVPVAVGPERPRCFDLTGEFQIEGSKIQTFRFIGADRLVLLEPTDLSDRYRKIQHRFTATLFDGLDCTGDSVSFKSAVRARGSVKLDGYKFRDRTRSVRIAYESGVLATYLETPQASEAPPQTAAEPAQTPQPTPEPENQAAEAAPTPEPAVAPESETAAKAPEPRPIPSATSAPAAQRSPPEIDWTETAQPAPGPAPAPAETVARTVTEPAPSPTAIQQAMPKLEPTLLPETKPSPALASQTFQYPIHDIYRLNYCLNWDRNCGEAAAQAWCKIQGFGRSSGFKIDENIGSLFPTFVLGENQICARFICDGFQEITCAN